MQSFMGWIGGKRALRKAILEQFPQDITRYIEVFGGAGWVLFGKDPGHHLEVFNDADGSLINVYRCIKYHPEALAAELQGLPQSREMFFDFQNQADRRGYTDIQRAARTLYLIKMSFGSDRRTFATAQRIAVPYAKKAGIDPIKQNRPAIYQELLDRRQAEQDEAQRRMEAIEGIEGLKEIRAALADLEAWNEEFERSFDDVGGLGVRPKPDYDLNAMYKRYPRATAYLQAHSWSLSSNYYQAHCGTEAMEKIINGESYEQAIEKMKSNWEKHCEEHMWD